jgi:dihydropteroate synthase
VLNRLPFKRPQLVGILNLTDDSFSDGGRYLDPERAIAHAEKLMGDGADLIELGPAASNPRAAPVSAEEEIRRITPVMDWLVRRGAAVAVDSARPQTQLYALERGAACLNDVEGFAHPAIYGALARSTCRLVVVHALQEEGRAVRVETDPLAIYERLRTFLKTRLVALMAAGVARERLIIDPGMGLFLGSNPEPSSRFRASRFSAPSLGARSPSVGRQRSPPSCTPPQVESTTCALTMLRLFAMAW